MPWTHCEIEGILDDVSCPECGLSKDQWTLEFNVTRTFAVQRRPTLRVVLLDAQEEGVAAEPYRVELPDGQVEEGQLDEEGTVRIAHGQPGDCTITFTARATGGVVPYVPPEEEEEDAAAEEGAAEEEPQPEATDESEEETAAEEGPPSFTRPANRRSTFQLETVPVLQLTLVDELAQDPLRFVSYTLEAADGTRFEGTTDGAGRIDHGVVTPPAFALTVTAEWDDETYDGACTAPTVLSCDAWLQLRVPGIPPCDHAPHEFHVHEVADLSLILQTRDGTRLAEARYELTIEDEEPIEGTTDDEGLLEEDLPEGAERGHLKVWHNDILALEVDLQIGEPEPVEELKGGQARLASLGYFPGALDGDLGPKMQNALKSFQKANQLDASGEYDAATQTKLGELSKVGRDYE